MPDSCTCAPFDHRVLLLRHTQASTSHSIARHLGVALRSNTSLDALVLRRAPIPVQAVRGDARYRQLELWALSESHVATEAVHNRDDSSLPPSSPRRMQARGDTRAVSGTASASPVSVEEVVIGSLLPVNCVATRVNAVALRGPTCAVAHAQFRPYELRFLAHRVALSSTLRTLK